MRQNEINTAGKTETFLTRNVRLITFLICMAVFFSVFGPLSIFHIRRYIEENREDPRDEMTLADLRYVAENLKTLRTSYLDKFEGEFGENDMGGITYAIYRIPIEERYTLSVSFDRDKNHLFYCTLIDSNGNKRLDLLTDAADLEDFLKGLPVD